MKAELRWQITLSQYLTAVLRRIVPYRYPLSISGWAESPPTPPLLARAHLDDEIQLKPPPMDDDAPLLCFALTAIELLGIH